MSEFLDLPNERFEPLVDILRTVKRTGNFCTSGTLSTKIPQVSVDGVGKLSFPVPNDICRKLIMVASKSPYGKGEKTIIDETVRKSWQIELSQVKIDDAKWFPILSQIDKRVAEDLGLPEFDTFSDMYKLLVYEPGGFFAPHKDSEKEPGMVATLVISLPVEGSGGELVVQHGNNKCVIDMCSDDASALHYAAFYADCVHEIKPVREGYRIALVFNLLVNEIEEDFSSAPDHHQQIGEVADFLNNLKTTNWFCPAIDETTNRNKGVHKIVWPLEHGYSEDGISFSAMKGIDRTHALVLKEAAACVDFSIRAAIWHATLHGGPSDFDSLLDSDGYPMGEIEMEEVHDEEFFLDDWMSPDGHSLSYGQIPLNQHEVVSNESLQDIIPDENWVDESYGNEGVTVSQAYRISALVLWPTDRSTLAMSAGGKSALVSYLEAELNRPNAKKSELISYGRQLIDYWPQSGLRQRHSYVELEPNWESDCLDFSKQLVVLGVRQLAVDFVTKKLMPEYCGKENKAIIEAARLIGYHGTWQGILEFNDKERLPYIADTLELIGSLYQVIGNSSEDEVTTLFCRLAEFGVTTLSESVDINQKPIISVAIACKFFKMLTGLELAGQAEKFARQLARAPDTFDPFRNIPELLGQLKSLEGFNCNNSTAFGILWESGAKQLLNRSGSVLKQPEGWVIPLTMEQIVESNRSLLFPYRIEQEISQGLKGVLSVFVNFCNDWWRQTRIIPARQELRESLSLLIDRMNLDIDYTTDASGSPHKLICKKNRNSFARRIKEYEIDIKKIQELIANAPPGTDEKIRQRLLDAVANSFHAPREVVE